MIFSKSRRLVFGLAAWSALLAGCSTSSPAFKPLESIPAGQGVVYLYRPANSPAAADATVKANRVPIARIAPGGYFPYVGKPGAVYFQLGPDTANVAYVRVQRATEKYLKLADASGRLKLEPVAPEVGLREIAACGIQAPLPAGTASTPAAAPRESATPPAPPPRAATPVPSRRPSGARVYSGAPNRARASAAVAPRGIQGPYSFEAERIAMERGCTTRDGVRPTAYLVQRADALQVYDIACQEATIRVGCQFEYCQTLGR